MQTITTHQTIDLTGTTFTVTTDSGQYLGEYYQEHGADVVTSADLPAEDQGVIGAIEAIAALARAAGIRGFKLSDQENVSYGDDLVAEVLRRVESVGGYEKTYIEDVYVWGEEMGVGVVAATGAVMAARDREGLPA